MSYLRKSPICLACKKFLVGNQNCRPNANEVVLLKDCSKCKFAKYCSVKCQKQHWKEHKKHCEAFYTIAYDLKKLEDDHPGIGEHKEITNQDIEQVLEQRSICYLIKIEHENYHDFLGLYESYNRCLYLYTRLFHAKMYWYHAEANNAYFLYEKYYSYIKDLIKCCPVLMDCLIYYFVMSLIHLGFDDAAFKVINVWCFDFEYCPNEDLVLFLKAMLHDDWSKLPQHYNKYSTTKDDMLALRIYADSHDRWNTEEAHYQLLPFVPAILAIKHRNLMSLHEKKLNFENFVEAINGDYGQLKTLSVCYWEIIQRIGTNVLGFTVKKFNQIMQTQVDDVQDIIHLVQHWKTTDLDFLHGGICDHLPHLMENVPRHFSWKDNSGIEKWIRIYGIFFIRLTGELTKEEENKMPWRFGGSIFVTEMHNNNQS